ncbi:abscisic-aldehyde oxidase-like, partial [Trifolium medium]|nr:abscisic-aldehyde oxidase-like [Trifolium medium]
MQSSILIVHTRGISNILFQAQPVDELLKSLRLILDLRALKRVRAFGEPPLLLAASVHCATRSAVKEARKQLLSWSNLDESDSTFQLGVTATAFGKGTQWTRHCTKILEMENGQQVKDLNHTSLS